MNKKQIIFWSVIAVVVIGVLCFLKYNPLYATFETMTAFVLGLCAEGIGKWVYDKWVKKEDTETTETTTEKQGGVK